MESKTYPVRKQSSWRIDRIISSASTLGYRSNNQVF